MLRVVFFDLTTGVTLYETVAVSGSVSFKLNETTEWSVSVLRTEVDAARLEQGGVAADLYLDGVFLVGGKCQRTPDKGKAVLDIKGRQWGDLLFEASAYSQAVYKDTPILVVLGQLLRQAGWRLGDISTLADRTQKTTIDLRQSDQLLPQISTLLQGIPGVFMRYGGEILGQHSLDIGSFGQDSGIQLIEPADNQVDETADKTGWILEANREVDVTDIYYQVEVFGGEVQQTAAITRSINLGDALAATPALAADPDFPIVEVLANFIWRIRNNAVLSSAGITGVKRFTQYAPERSGSPATATDIQNAGLAAYNRGVAFLKDHATNIEVVDIDAKGNLSILPKIGDLMFVRFTKRTELTSPFTEVVRTEERVVSGSYRCTAVTLRVDNDKSTWAFSLSSGRPVSFEDSFVSVYDAVQQEPPPAGAVFTPAFAPTMAVIALTVGGGLPDTVMADGSPGKLVAFTLPAAPGGATNVYQAGTPYIVAASPAIGVRIEMVSDPVFGGAGPVARISINDTWEPSYSADLEVRIIWI